MTITGIISVSITRRRKYIPQQQQVAHRAVPEVTREKHIIVQQSYLQRESSRHCSIIYKHLQPFYNLNKFQVTSIFTENLGGHNGHDACGYIVETKGPVDLAQLLQF